MGIRIKVDEDLPKAIAVLLRQAGHDALTVPQQGLTGTQDVKLWPIVQAERRMLMTADVPFADIRRHPPGTHRGVVLLRPESESRSSYLRLCELLLKSKPLEELIGTVTVVTETKIRVRRKV
jgi:predicted nuclease of predicted toxin-antitoxin system